MFICIGKSISVAKLRKKVVKNNGFWKINAIRPEMFQNRNPIEDLGDEVNDNVNWY